MVLSGGSSAGIGPKSKLHSELRLAASNKACAPAVFSTKFSSTARPTWPAFTRVTGVVAIL